MAHSISFVNLEWIEETTRYFMQSPENDMGMPSGPEPAFGDALLAVAAGDDPVWTSFKDHVGSFHWTPEEAFRLACPDAKAAELSVICWVLPQTQATNSDNRNETLLPAERWARSRIFGESRVNNGLRKHLVDAFATAGIQAVAPMLLPEWGRRDSEAFTVSSTWSERHAAYAAGLGTFGLCDGLITPLGKAMRVGSVIARLRLPPTPRPYTSHTEYCLFYSSGACRACIKRCPAGAISEKGHDKKLCGAYLDEVTAPYVTNTFHFKGYGCGLCQVGVPCEKGIPGR